MVESVKWAGRASVVGVRTSVVGVVWWADHVRGTDVMTIVVVGGWW